VKLLLKCLHSVQNSTYYPPKDLTKEDLDWFQTLGSLSAERQVLLTLKYMDPQPEEVLIGKLPMVTYVTYNYIKLLYHSTMSK